MKSPVSYLIACLIFLSTESLIAQKQNNIWYFGFNAGLDFNSGSPVSLLNGALSSDEGCATISDKNGNLLFYSNGEIIYNRLHQPMPNGSGLDGHNSSTQSVLIVKSIIDDSLYYVFTTPAILAIAGGAYTGLSYSIVDMRMQNTFGDVSQKNLHLIDSVPEKLTATRHKNGKDVWIVVRKWNTNAYYSYLLTCNGISAPVISHAGRIEGPDPAGIFWPTLGCMTISPDGSKLACTWPSLNAQYEGSSFLDIMDFDNATGKVKNSMSDTHTASPVLDIRGYGVCFSPNGRRLYLSEYGSETGIGFGRIMQYNLEDHDIMNTEVYVADSYRAYGTMQIAPDGMIYCARLNGADYLSRITYPDSLDFACGFDEAGIPLSGKISAWGLPNNWDNFKSTAPYSIFEFRDTILCGAKSLFLDATYKYPGFAVSYKWNNGSINPTQTITQSGSYWVNIFLDCDTLRDTIDVTFDNHTIEFGNDRSLCMDDSIKLDASGIKGEYLWNNGSLLPSIIVKQSGFYKVIITDTSGCIISDSIQLTFSDCNCSVYVPNSFTPNNDGINEVFGPQYSCDFREYKFSIFNRWGECIFTSTDPGEKWNGSNRNSDQLSDVFCWTLNYSWFNGISKQTKNKSGIVSLIP